MPKLPRISGQKAIRALNRLGFVAVRQKGSHIIMQRGSATCVVPNHSELRIGTLAGVLKQADVSLEEFIQAL